MSKQALDGVTGVVLAGGQSRRFGDRDKALAPLSGRPLLAHVVETVRAVTGRPPVVAVRSATRRRRYQAHLDDVAFVVDAASFDGPLAGVVAGVSAVETPWSFVCGCDMPLLSPAAIRWLDDYRARNADAVAVRRPNGVPEPVHALYRRDAIEAVRSRLPRDGGVHSLLAELERTRTPSVADAPEKVALADSLTNVNTAAELDEIRRRRESLGGVEQVR